MGCARGFFTQQLLLEWRPTLLGTRRCCVLCSLNNNTLAGLFFTATLFEDAEPLGHLFFTCVVIITCSNVDLGCILTEGPNYECNGWTARVEGGLWKVKQTSLWSHPTPLSPRTPSGCWSCFIGPHHGFLDSPEILTLHFPDWLREYFLHDLFKIILLRGATVVPLSGFVQPNWNFS